MALQTASLEEEKIWERWFKDRDEAAANALVLHYRYLVSYHVERIAINVPKSMSKEDLESFALSGLFDALQKFEPERGLKFDTYASIRIRGAIMDGLRNEDWLPRSLREKAKQIETVSQQLEQKYQRPPSAKEIGRQLNMTAEEVENHIHDVFVANVISIESKFQEDDDSEGIGSVIPDEQTLTPDEHVLQEELKKELVQSIRSLNENEQLVISLFYQEELSMTEIGEILNLTTSRISQIHKQAIFKLRHTIEKIQSNRMSDGEK